MASGTRELTTKHTQAAFPLGGIGTGNVSLGTRGEFRDWEIFNRPAKGNTLPNTFFAIRAEQEGQRAVARILEGSVQPPHNRSHGYYPTTMAGLPHMRETTFRGEYPIAQIDFRDPVLPVNVSLEAFTPLVPLDAAESGLPCAILMYTVSNPTKRAIRLTLVGSLINPVGSIKRDPFENIVGLEVGRSTNVYRQHDLMRGLFMSNPDIKSTDLHYGNLSLVTTHPQVTVKPGWLRGNWWDYVREFWDDFSDDGLLKDLGYTEPSAKPETGSIGVLDTLFPGETRTFRFILTWFFPNRVNGWSFDTSTTTRNYYATRFRDAWDVAGYVCKNIDQLTADTKRFHNALFSSTVPAYVLDAVSANIVPVRSNTCFWREDGQFFGWEGCFDDAGCCHGTCTHVWSYAQTVAFLFPSLERAMRRNEFVVEMDDDGWMSHRTHRPFESDFVWLWGSQRAESAVDGHMGSILRAYREWLLSGDKAWLDEVWPGIKRSIDFASVQWDSDGDHVLDGKQHNTYDIEFYGPNPLGGVFYLAALRAVEALAGVMNEPEIARRCHEAFETGSANLDRLLWNGEYYIQKLDDVDAYMYQHGTGCLIDQLTGQFHASVVGLGPLLPPEHIKTALLSLYRYNFKANFYEHIGTQRTFVLNDESGVVMCTWPHGGRPRYPFVYSDEVMSGMEYQLAAQLLFEGYVDEGLSIVKAIRDRHDGIKRNPWDETECGHHYARSMASWAVLNALSGMRFDAHQNLLSFNPLMGASTAPDEFRCFWSNGVTWGTLHRHRNAETGDYVTEVEVLGRENSEPIAGFTANA